MSKTEKKLTRRQQRVIAMTCIYQYLLREEMELDDLFADNLALYDKSSIPYIVTLTIESLEHYEEYEALINERLTDWTFDRLGFVEQAILLLAVHEIKTDEDVKMKRVYINEAVELAKEYCDAEAYRLINGVLDKL